MEVIAIAATSLDGYITRGDEPGTAFTSQADKDWFSSTLTRFPIKIIGRKTFEVSRKPIMQLIQAGSKDLRIVLTGNPEKYRGLEDSNHLWFRNNSPETLLEEIRKVDQPNMRMRIAILGGSAVYSTFLESGLIDEFWVTLEPQLFGSGMPLLKQETYTLLALRKKVPLGPSTLLLKYRCKNKTG